MSKINWFDANRSMSVAVADFMKCFVWKREIHEKYAREIASVETSLAGLEKLQGSIYTDKLPEMRTALLAKIAELEKEESNQVALEGTYVLTEEDKKLKKALSDYARGKDVDTVGALVVWFKYHGLEVANDNPIIEEIFSAAGERLHVKNLVVSGGKTATTFNATNCFKMVFAKCYEHMVNAGTIKATQIPPIIAEKYAPKKGKKRA